METTVPENTQQTALNKYINNLATKWHRTYLGFTCLFALIGYALVLLFPVLAITACINIYEILPTSEIIDWIFALAWFVILVSAALLCYRSIQLKPSAPTGLTISEEKAPEIFKLVQQLHIHFKRPTIQRIVITADYELDIAKVPKSALPVWSTNTLIIGLPVLLCHSPKQFECIMARRLGQFSRQCNLVENWLYQLRAIWKRYSLAYGKQKYPESKLLKWFYDAYASLYLVVSVFAARKDELNADSYAMEVYTDVEVCEMITANAVYQWYLQESFWPAVNKIASVKKNPSLTPYTNIASNIHTNLKGEKLESLIDKIFNFEPLGACPVPSLRSRLDNIGHNTPSMPADVDAIAATHYLGASLNGVINIFDKLWLKNYMDKQKTTR